MHKLMKEKRLDAVVFTLSNLLYATSIRGFPVVIVPPEYSSSGKPFDICFTGLWGSGSTLIEIAYAFEQATMPGRNHSYRHSRYIYYIKKKKYLLFRYSISYFFTHY
ncbi:hypothetical protein KSP40_PGU001242 [Platanthera guangdongensis]|uniref:Uncharacterized protein n=1 Tax=Platanthera guangdongensis TaxID=2320717 RepID=A0ABR2MU40_9ASPA